MISLESEPDPFKSFSYSQTMMDSPNNNTNEVSSLDLDSGGGVDTVDVENDDLASQPLSATTTHSNNNNNDRAGGSTTSAAAANNTVSAQGQFPKKSSLRSRWLVLGLACVVMTGSYYAYDIPSALHQQLQDYMPPSSNYETKFNLLYTVYSIPNVILPLFGGNVVDTHGAPLCLTLFASMVCLGAVLLSIGVANKAWEVMYIGRFVFGLGAESLCVAQSTIISDWFEGREVAFAMGIGLAVSRLGSIWNNVVSPKVANNSSIVSAFWIGALLTCCSSITAGLIVFVDRRASRMLTKRRTGVGVGGGEALQSLTEALLEDYDEGPGGDGLLSTEVNEGDDPALVGDENNDQSTKKACTAMVESGVHITDVQKFGPLFWLLTLSCFVVYGCVLPFNNVASGILLERNFFTLSPENCKLEYPNQCSVGYLQQGNNSALDASTGGDVCLVAPSQAPVLPSSVNHTSRDSEHGSEWEEPSYIFPSLTSQNVDCGDSFWMDACTNDYCQKQNDATEHAGRVMSIPYLISALSSPLLGHLVDRIGRRAQIAVLSSCLLFGVHLTLALSDSSPIGPMLGQGIAYSLYAAVLWPSVPLTVPKQYVGTAFGVITSIQNIGLALFPLMIATIYNASGRRYIPNVEFFFMSCATAGILVGIFLNRLDRRRYGSKLNKAPIQEAEEETIEVEEITDNGTHRQEGGGDFAGVEDEFYYSPLMHS